MSTGFSFGAKTTAAPSFGTGSITFGTPASQPASQYGFGGLSTSAPSLFGTPTATTSNLAFKPTGFGAPAPAASTGFGLGAPTTQTSGFGVPAAGLSFGAPAAATTGGLSFGTPASTSGGLGFGAPAVSTGGLSFGAPTSAPGGLSFGTPASTGTALSSGGGLTFGAPTSTAAPTGLSFGTPASTGLAFSASSAPTLGLGFASTATAPSLSFTTTTTSAGLGGLGFVATSTPGTGGLNLMTTTATQQSVGLGGIASTTQSKANTTTHKEVPPREQPLPNEFLHLVDQFKNVVLEEKNRSSEVARCSIKEFHKVETELDLLNQQFNQVENQLQNNRNLAEKLKFDTAKGLQNIEMAQRTQDTPPSLQFNNATPLQFFLDLADTFERELQILKMKIDNTEKFVKKCNEPSFLTSQDLAVGMKRLHETFVALAGRMQAVHSQVEVQKEIFLSLRKQTTKDNVNPFERVDKHIEAMNTILKSVSKAAPPNLASGPTPFNSIALGSNNLSLAQQQANPPAYPSTTNTSTLGFGLGSSAASAFGAQTSNTSMFKPTGFGASQPFQLNTSSNFQLQKPPTGNKRGKQ